MIKNREVTKLSDFPVFFMKMGVFNGIKWVWIK